MKPIVWVGIVLVVLGALALAYQGINYTRQKDVLNLGSIHATTQAQERIPLLRYSECWLWLEDSHCWSWGQ
jgi:hypothetical protein